MGETKKNTIPYIATINSLPGSHYLLTTLHTRILHISTPFMGPYQSTPATPRPSYSNPRAHTSAEKIRFPAAYCLEENRPGPTAGKGNSLGGEPRGTDGPMFICGCLCARWSGSSSVATPTLPVSCATYYRSPFAILAL